MKKIALVITLMVFVLTGCGESGNTTNEITIQAETPKAEKKEEPREKKRTGAIPGDGQKYDPGNW